MFESSGTSGSPGRKKLKEKTDKGQQRHEEIGNYWIGVNLAEKDVIYHIVFLLMSFKLRNG